MSGMKERAPYRKQNSICKVCLHGVYEDQKQTLGRGQWLGICHTACLVEAGQVVSS